MSYIFVYMQIQISIFINSFYYTFSGHEYFTDQILEIFLHQYKDVFYLPFLLPLLLLCYKILPCSTASKFIQPVPHWWTLQLLIRLAFISNSEMNYLVNSVTLYMCRYTKKDKHPEEKLLSQKIKCIYISGRYY